MTGLRPPIADACLCGEVAYVSSASPVWSANCHCRSCQQASGAPFVSAFSVPADSFSMTGETVGFRRTAEAGHGVTTWHCAACGSRMCAQSDGAPHLINVFAATLSDPSRFVPISNVYLSEAAPWIVIPDARFNFPKMPQA